MVSFGHAAFFGIGAYVVGILAQHATYGQPIMTWPLTIPGTTQAVIVWPLAMLVAGLFALVIGAICLRTGGLSFIMITLAFAQMIFFFFISLDTYGGEDGLSLFSRSKTGPLDIDDDVQFYYLVAVLVALFLFLKHRLIHSPFGAVLQGIRDNEPRMRALGYPTYRYKLTAFVIAGAVAGLAGALIANQTQFISPSFLDWHRSGEIMVIVILGGIGSLFGPLLGSAAFLLLRRCPLAMDRALDDHSWTAVGAWWCSSPGKGFGVWSGRSEGHVTEPLLQTRDLTKAFGAIRACDGVSLSVNPGRNPGSDRPQRCGQRPP